MRHFEAVARHLNFTKAAEELCVTQAAVSHQVKALEDQLGVRLFTRSGRHVELTEEGRTLLQVARDSFDRLAACARQISRKSPQAREVLTVRVTPWFSSRWLMPRIPGFTQCFPDIELEIHHTQAPLSRNGQTYEIAIHYGDGYWSGMAADFLFGADLVPLCSPKLLAEGAALKTPADLANHTVIYETSHDWWADWLERADAKSVVPRRRIVVDDPNVLLDAALQDQGLILGPPDLFTDLLRRNQLAMPFDRALAVDIDYYLIVSPDMLALPKVRAFREWLLQEAADYRSDSAGTSALRNESHADETHY